MEFHFVGIKTGGAATIIDVNSKPRFICFKEPKTARVYIKYICEHKSKFGTWPGIDLSSPITKVRFSQNDKKEDSKFYEDLLEIKNKTIEDLDNMSVITGISYFYCHKFAYDNIFSLSISGQEVDGHIDKIMYREHLDYSLKNS